MKDKYYYKDGTTSTHDISRILHREDGPAVEFAEGGQYWFVDDTLLLVLTKEYLVKYMELKDFTVAHLLTDSNEMIRNSAAKYDWNDLVKNKEMKEA